MAKNTLPTFGLKSIDDIFSTQEMRDDEKLEVFHKKMWELI